MEKYKKILIVGIIIILVICGISYNKYDSISQELFDEQQQNLKYENLINSTSTEMQGVNAQITYYQNIISTKNDSLDEINSELTILQSGKDIPLKIPYIGKL